jgi:hypothetical protein
MLKIIPRNLLISLKSGSRIRNPVSGIQLRNPANNIRQHPESGKFDIRYIPSLNSMTPIEANALEMPFLKLNLAPQNPPKCVISRSKTQKIFWGGALPIPRPIPSGLLWLLDSRAFDARYSVPVFQSQ